MIEQNVQVVRCDDERIWVRMGSQVGCPACDSGKGCGAGVFSRLLQRKPVTMELARNEMNIRVGQMVTLAFPERVYLNMVLTYFGWPLVSALIGAFAGFGFGSWLQFSALMLDFSTLAGGLSAGGLAMYTLRTRKAAGTVLDAMQVAVFYPSSTPNMCSGSGIESVNN